MRTITAWTEAPPFPPLSDGSLHLWWMAYAPAAADPGAEDVLSSDERSRAQRMPQGGRFAFFRSSLRRILAGYLAAEPAALVFDYGRHGKPRLRGGSRRPGFNLAHCGNRGLLAVMDDAEVGVDLERVRPVPNDLRIARRQLGAALAAGLEALPVSERSREFLRHWTAMEACIKLRGEGVFARSGRPCVPASFVPADGWVAAVACSATVPPVEDWGLFIFAPRPGRRDHRQAPGLPV
jgi:4'-phosphopantetheinyl transferase